MASGLVVGWGGYLKNEQTQEQKQIMNITRNINRIRITIIGIRGKLSLRMTVVLYPGV